MSLKRPSPRFTACLAPYPRKTCAVRPMAQKWNNEELLFHMLFGYMIAVWLIRIVKLARLATPGAAHRAIRPAAQRADTTLQHGKTISAQFSARKVYNHKTHEPEI